MKFFLNVIALIFAWSSLLADFNVTLSDAIFRNAGITVKAISDDGKLILALNFGAANQKIPELELFENVDGKLVRKATLPLDDFAFNGDVDDCFVDDNFETFGVIDDNGKNKVRIRLLKLVGNTFKVVKKVIYNDAIAVALNGNITGDGKFIMVNYTNNKSTNTTLVSSIKLLNSDLKTLHKFNIKGLSNGPQSFVLNQNGEMANYFLFGFSGFDLTTSNFTAPAFLQAYKVSNNKLNLVDQAELPQFPVTYFADNHNTKNPRIAAGTTLALESRQVSIFQDTTGAMTFIPGDDQNIREYRFNGESLRLIATTKTDSSFIVSNFYKDRKTIGISKANEVRGSGIPSNTFNLTFLKTDDHNNFKCRDGALTVPSESFFVLFSKNGKYMVCGGDPVATDSGSPRGIFNLNLFKVND